MSLLVLLKRYKVSLTEYAVKANVTRVEITQTAKNCHKTLLRISRYEIMDTVGGINKSGIFLSKKSDTGSRFFVLIIPEISIKKRIIIARMLPGNGKGRNPAIISEIMKRTNRIIVFANIFKTVHLGIKMVSQIMRFVNEII